MLNSRTAWWMDLPIDQYDGACIPTDWTDTLNPKYTVMFCTANVEKTKIRLMQELLMGVCLKTGTTGRHVT